MVTSSILSVLQARIIDKICCFFFTKTQRFRSVVLDIIGPGRLVRYAGGCLCITVIPKEMNKASLRALEGTRLPKKSFKGKRLNKKVAEREAIDFSPTRGH